MYKYRGKPGDKRTDIKINLQLTYMKPYGSIPIISTIYVNYMLNNYELSEYMIQSLDAKLIQCLYHVYVIPIIDKSCDLWMTY